MKLAPRFLSICKTILKILAALTCLYFFICSLDFLATSFRLLAGKNTGKVFRQSQLLENPIVGVMLGVLATVLVQSSSTTTSIIVGMVASDILAVQQAIPMVMGANIGTSVTNTIVSITQIGDRKEFERAFACAVVHDFFNWLSVIVLLPLEVITHYLFYLTNAIVEGIEFQSGEKPPDILKKITKPFTKAFIQIDKNVLEGWSTPNNTMYENYTSMMKDCSNHNHPDYGNPLVIGSLTTESPVALKKKCYYVFMDMGLSDVAMGLILLAISLFMLCLCLILLVKILNSMMQDKMAEVIKKVLNADIPYVPWLTGYLAMIIGAIITFVVQSSSVFTSTLTPLVGTGLFTLERAYPLTLGSNIGTTTTGMLAALAADGDHLRDSLQIALCHLFFNISGIILFYPISYLRFPIPISKTMGKTVAKYRWFAIAYLIIMFFLFPSYVFGLSLLGPIAIYIGFIPLLLLFLIIIIINVIQKKKPQWLPQNLRSWQFLPKFLRSLEPYDRTVSKITCKICKRKESDSNQSEDLEMNFEKQ